MGGAKSTLYLEWGRCYNLQVNFNENGEAATRNLKLAWCRGYKFILVSIEEGLQKILKQFEGGGVTSRLQINLKERIQIHSDENGEGLSENLMVNNLGG